MDDYTETDLIEIYEERAAIREYDGGLDRNEAEVAAYWDWRRLVGPQVAAPQHICRTVEHAKTSCVSD